MTNVWACRACGTWCDSSHDHDIIECKAQQRKNAKPDSILGSCETCEGHGRINCAPDEDGFTHPCEDCQPVANKIWNEGFKAAEHYAKQRDAEAS